MAAAVGQRVGLLSGVITWVTHTSMTEMLVLWCIWTRGGGQKKTNFSHFCTTIENIMDWGQLGGPIKRINSRNRLLSPPPPVFEVINYALAVWVLLASLAKSYCKNSRSRPRNCSLCFYHSSPFAFLKWNRGKLLPFSEEENVVGAFKICSARVQKGVKKCTCLNRTNLLQLWDVKSQIFAH